MKAPGAYGGINGSHYWTRVPYFTKLTKAQREICGDPMLHAPTTDPFINVYKCLPTDISLMIRKIAEKKV